MRNDIETDMKQKLLILILLISNFGFSQTKKSDYEIYSKIINEISSYWYKSNNNIILVEQLKNIDPKIFYLFEELAKENYETSEIALSYLSRKHNEAFKDKLIQKPNLKIAMRDFLNNLDNQPKIKSENINIENIHITSISSKKYDSFFKKHDVGNGWKEIEKTYKTKLILEFSRITYNQNFACVYYSIHCGGTCGDGSVIILEKINNEWTILNIINLWES